jgi:hypothetical protein
MRHHPEMKSWEEWKARCALALCGPDTQADLMAFVSPILAAKVRRMDPLIQLSLGKKQGDHQRDYFHLFESYMHCTSGVTGKRWKDWLFQVMARSGDSNQTALERAACSCLRTIAGKIYIDEGSGRASAASVHVVSSDAPISDGSDPLAALLADESAPDPACEAEVAELREIADSEAEARFPSVAHPMRIGLLSLVLEKKLTDPAFAAAAGRSLSTLYAQLEKFPAVLRDELAEKYESEDPRTIQLLTLFTVQELGKRIFSWARSEISCQPLFTGVEESEP